MDVKELLKSKYGLELPNPPKPIGVYRPISQVGNVLYLSGQTSTRDGQLLYKGVVGKDYTVEEAQVAARICALNLLAVLYEYLEGDLSQVKQVVQMVGYVRSAEGFGDQPAVINGAAQLFVDVYGEAGIPSRLALGTNELPGGAPVEVMAVVELKA